MKKRVPTAKDYDVIDGDADASEVFVENVRRIVSEELWTPELTRLVYVDLLQLFLPLLSPHPPVATLPSQQ